MRNTFGKDTFQCWCPFFQTFTLAFLAANTPTSKAEDSAIEQSSGTTNSPNTPSGVFVNSASPAVSVPEGGFSAEGDLSSVTPQSLSPFNEYTSGFRLSPALPEDKRSGVIFHLNVKSSEEHSIGHPMDLEHPQISTTSGSQDRLIMAYPLSLLPDYDLSIINLSKTNTVEGNTPNTSHNQTHGRIQDGLNILPRPDNEEEARTDRHKELHNSPSGTSYFDSRGLTFFLPYNSEESNSDRPPEGSGSGSGLYSNNQEFDGVTTAKTVSSILNSTISFKVDNAGKKTRSTGVIMDSETDNDTDGAGSKISSKKECETAAEKEVEENESELSGEEEEKTDGEGELGIGNQRVRKVDGETDESARRLNSTAGSDMLKEKETEFGTVVGKTVYTETGSGDEIESNFRVFRWPVDVSGSGEGGGEGGEVGKVKGKKVSDDKGGIKAVGEKEGGDKGDGREGSNKEVLPERRDGLQLSVSQDKPAADFSLFGSSEENGSGHDEEGRDTSLDIQVVRGNSTLDNKEGDGGGERNGGLESEERMEGGGREESDVIGESLQQFSSMERLLFDAARSPVLGRLVPLLRLTDGNEAAEEQLEGKCYSMPCFSSALPLRDRRLSANLQSLS